MQIVDKNIEELIPYAKNPRKNDEAVWQKDSGRFSLGIGIARLRRRGNSAN